MESYPKVSDAEWEVMKVLWEESPLTSSEIVEAIKNDMNWSPKTVHTLISRLVKKNAVYAEKNTATYKYSPLVSQSDLRKDVTKSFLQKIYGGSLQQLISSFIKEESITDEEIEDLKRILDKKSN